MFLDTYIDMLKTGFKIVFISSLFQSSDKTFANCLTIFRDKLRSSENYRATADLTNDEINEIQLIANEIGRPIVVVGSAASGTRRNRGTDLPVGKGFGTKSDIDYVLPGRSQDFLEDWRWAAKAMEEGALGSLPSMGWNGIFITNEINENGFRVWFAPNRSPIFLNPGMANPQSDRP